MSTRSPTTTATNASNTSSALGAENTSINTSAENTPKETTSPTHSFSSSQWNAYLDICEVIMLTADQPVSLAKLKQVYSDVVFDNVVPKNTVSETVPELEPEMPSTTATDITPDSEIHATHDATVNLSSDEVNEPTDFTDLSIQTDSISYSTSKAAFSTEDLHRLLDDLAARYENRPLTLVKVASGYRFQARRDYTELLKKLARIRPQKLSRALLETLALIAYKQPITRGEIEHIRGVVVSSQIIKTLLEKNWIKVVGYRNIPGKPALYGTTRNFLDDLNLTHLSELPELISSGDPEDETTATVTCEQLSLPISNPDPVIDSHSDLVTEPEPIESDDTRD